MAGRHFCWLFGFFARPTIEGGCVTWKVKFYATRLLFMTLPALPAFAQFEVSPDHFVDASGASSGDSNSRRQDELRQQIAIQQARLESYRKRIEAKAASVEQARQVMLSAASPDGAGECVDLYMRQRELEALQQSLAGPIREAKAVLAGLERERDGLLAGAQASPPTAGRHSRRPTRNLLALSRRD
jgi:hypothetical protein